MKFSTSSNSPVTHKNEHKSKLSRRNSLSSLSCARRAAVSVWSSAPIYLRFMFHFLHTSTRTSYDHQFFATWNFLSPLLSLSWCEVMNGVFNCLTLWPTPRWWWWRSLPSERKNLKRRSEIKVTETADTIFGHGVSCSLWRRLRFSLFWLDNKGKV